ncbi:hypothetical protein PG999_007384 [Apiospora kogelbergensis]|uniref:CorA-like transporter domain-containing protein n=1 Tax=Apiospora kogelbergensis TaxID=1337665 RepID=A0AAW0QY50_9PEZI
MAVVIYLNAYRLEKYKLEEYLQKKFPNNFSVQNTEDDKYMISTSEALSQDQKDEIEELHLERAMINNEDELETHYKKHLRNKEPEPRMRHVFLTADHSAAPLDCTMNMFQYLCTYHQVYPEFLGMVFSFGRRSEQYNFHHLHILHQLSNNGAYSNMEMPEIGRSGKQLRVAYKLFAMERQEVELGGKWVMRQTATYHTQDLVKWKTLWITVKANDLIRERVDEANTTRCGPARLSTPAEAISRSLAIHHIMFDWCTDGWGLHITEIADEVESILVPATAALIPPEKDSLDPLPGIIRSLSSLSSLTAVGGSPTDEKIPSSARSTKPALSMSQILSVQNDGASTTDLPTKIEQELEQQIQSTTDRLSVLKVFSFSGVRQLDVFCNKLRDARTAITANLNMAGEISEVYRNILESNSYAPKERDEDFTNAVRQFQDDLRSIEHHLKSICLRIDNIMERMNAGKSLYYHILDLQRTELDKLFALKQHVSSERMQLSSAVMQDVTNKMHDIAKRTERDTSSMHFITFLTLFFLPGTFLGSLFSTPIFATPDPGSVLKLDSLILFLEICVPMMFVFVTLWIAYRIYKRKERRGKGNQALAEDMV